MRLKRLLTADDAVSSVVAVTLMVAITVVLAAAIGTFTLGFAQKVEDTGPQASFGVDFEDDAGSYDNLTVTHEGGDAIASSALTLSASTTFNASFDGSDQGENATSLAFDDMGLDGDVTSGDSVTAVMDTDHGGEFDGETFRVIWSNPDSDQSQTLRKFEVPE
jgi:FlaG/FlaF family flagellin (archaellin)